MQTRIVEIDASSPGGFSSAVNLALQRANREHGSIEQVLLKDCRVERRDGRVTEYRVKLRLTVLAA